ncbi:MAG: protein-disulfide reductase DsbD [Zoogloeaceae bacterium]|nr:protein-disulfide reductase DsbD [Zoogloeaceae bacterium]
MSLLRRWLVLWLLLFVPAASAQEFLAPDIAFQAEVRALDRETLEVRFTIAADYYLYKDKFRFALEDAAPVTLGTPLLPRGKVKEDATFGKVEVFYKEAVIRLPLIRRASGTLEFPLRVTSQGCADAGLCYPPQTQTLAVTLPEAGAAFVPAEEGNDASGAIAARLENAGFWVNLAFFFVAGLLLAFTPCVLPMIPILSGILAGQGSVATGAEARRRGLWLSLLYVFGMALAYALAGVAAGLTGSLLSAALQTPWVLGAFAAVFVLLAFAMFGFYDLQLPVSWQNLLSVESGRLDRRLSARGFIRALAVFGMGVLSALIVGPCVAAPLAGALLYIGQTGDALLGGAALFVMGLGMGVPLIVVGLFSASVLPQRGAWMERVKKAFGVLLLATALWLVAPVLPAALTMFGWAALAIVAAIYLRALDPLPPRAGGWARFWKGVGILLLLAGAALFIGLLGGSRDPLQPLRVFQAGADGNVTESTALPFERVASIAELDTRLTILRETEQKPALLDFYADWCVACKEMERFTFAHPAVREKLSGFVRLQADVTANSTEDRALLRRFNLFGPPGILFFDAQGREIPGLRVVGFQDAETFLRILAQATRRNSYDE